MGGGRLERGGTVGAAEGRRHGQEASAGTLEGLGVGIGRGDLRDEAVREKAMKGADGLVHLAAIVGDPACALDPKLANDINESDKKKIADAGKAKIQKLSKEDVAAWRKAMEPVWKQFEGDIGRRLIDAALKANK